MKKLIIAASSFVLAFSLTIGIITYNKTSDNLLLMANLEALTNPENPDDGESGSPTNRKLTVCLCSSLQPTNGYYDWADMKNHCHDGVGNSCTGKVYNCPHTWYCNL